MVIYRITNRLVLLVCSVAVLLAGSAAPPPHTHATTLPGHHPSSHLPAPGTSAPAADTDLAALPIFGIEASSGKIATPELQTHAENLGVTWIRLNTLSWRDMQESATSDYNWDVSSRYVFEQELEAANQANLVPMVIVDDYPHWATTIESSCAALTEDHFDDFARFMQALVERYKDPPYNVRYWELGNEVDIDPSLVEADNSFGCWGDISDPYYGGEHYGEMLKVVTPAIKQVDPDAQVLIGGLLLDRPETILPGRGTPEHFLEGILRAEAADSFDIVAYHSYPWFAGRGADGDLADERWDQLGGSAVGKARFLREVMGRYGVNKPLFLNEGALLARLGFQDDNFFETQADHIVRVVSRAMAAGVEAFCWYTFHESGWYSGGLIDANYNPRPAYSAYQELIEQTADATATTTTSDYGAAVEAYRFDMGDHVVDVLWNRVPEERTLEIADNLFIAAYNRDGEEADYIKQGDTIRITLGFVPMYIWRLPAPVVQDPLITTVSPDEGYTSDVTPIVITGKHFLPGSTLALQPGADEQAISLSNVRFVSTTRMEAQVPAGLSAGLYDIVVSNPDGRQGTLPDAFNVLDPNADPQIRQIRPQYGEAGLPNDINIYGSNFITQEGFTVAISDTIVAAGAISGTHIRATIPADLLTPGVYTVTVTNPSGNSATLPASYTLYGADERDLTGYDYELWTDPIAPRTSTTTEVGLLINRRGGAPGSEEMTVSFAAGDTVAGGATLGAVNVALSEGATLASDAYVVWETPASGMLAANIDTANTISETVETNNQVSREVVVLPPAEDETPPVIVDLSINDGSATTTARSIPMRVQATDADPTTGVAWVFVMEYEYSQGTRRWWPVNPIQPAKSHWQPVEQFSGWELAGVPGKRYLQVWVADNAGNISAPVGGAVVYDPSGEGVQTSLPPEDVLPSTRYALPQTPAISNQVIRSLYLPVLKR